MDEEEYRMMSPATVLARLITAGVEVFVNHDGLGVRFDRPLSDLPVLLLGEAQIRQEEIRGLFPPLEQVELRGGPLDGAVQWVVPDLETVATVWRPEAEEVLRGGHYRRTAGRVFRWESDP